LISGGTPRSNKAFLPVGLSTRNDHVIAVGRVSRPSIGGCISRLIGMPDRRNVESIMRTRAVAPFGTSNNALDAMVPSAFPRFLAFSIPIDFNHSIGGSLEADLS